MLLTGTCFRTQEIEFKWTKHNAGLVSESWGVRVFIDGINVINSDNTIDQLAWNDGFKNRKEFFEWEAWNKKNFKGKIIHWTDLKY